MVLLKEVTTSRLLSLFKTQLFSGSLIMIFGSFATSFVNYLYHLILGRLLGPSDYGALASILSLVGLLGLISSSVGLVITKVVAGSHTNEETSQHVNALNKHIWLLGILTFLPLLLLSPFIAEFLRVEKMLLIIGLLIFLLSFPISTVRGVLQGLVKFKYMVVSQMSENMIRLAGSVFFVLVGFSVAGGLLGLLLGACSGWLVAWVYTKKYLQKPKISSLKINFKSTLKYSLPFLVLSVTITSMYSSDLILVKHFFSSFDTGLYAAMSFLGRIIFFGVSPVTAVMFPIVARNHSKGEDSLLVLKWSLAAGFLISILVDAAYGLFPDFVIRLLYGERYLRFGDLLVLFSVCISLITLSFLLLNYEAAINRFRAIWAGLFAALGQVSFIWLYHPSLFVVIFTSAIVSLLLFVFLVFDIFYFARKEIR